MSEPTIESLQTEIASLREQLAQQQAKFAALHAWAEKASAELKALRAAKPAAKPKPLVHKPGEFIEPPRYATFKGVKHRAYHGRTANTIGWRPCQAPAPQQTCEEPPPWDTEFVPE